MFFAAVILYLAYLAAAFQAAIFWFGINARLKAALQSMPPKSPAQNARDVRTLPPGFIPGCND
jgi:hypothetical protein